MTNNEMMTPPTSMQIEMLRQQIWVESKYNLYKVIMCKYNIRFNEKLVGTGTWAEYYEWHWLLDAIMRLKK